MAVCSSIDSLLHVFFFFQGVTPYQTTSQCLGHVDADGGKLRQRINPVQKVTARTFTQRNQVKTLLPRKPNPFLIIQLLRGLAYRGEFMEISGRARWKRRRDLYHWRTG